MNQLSRLAIVTLLPALVTTALMRVLLKRTHGELVSFDGMHLER